MCYLLTIFKFFYRFSKMPRSKTGKKRNPVDISNLKLAVNDVRQHSASVRDAAAAYNLSKTTLARHLKFQRESGESEFKYSGTNAVKKMFTEEEETQLENYLLFSCRLNYGLTKQEIRVLAYQYAERNNKSMPEIWKKEKRAGREWIRWFLKRHEKLSLRKAEATSLSRSTSFNKKNVSEFFDKLKKCQKKYNFSASNIYNVDETSNSTVHVPPRIVAAKGVKQVGSMTSGERGINITMIAGISAVGNHVPPMLIFPRVHFKEHMLNGAPPGTIGAANPSGWSNDEKFFIFMKHFIAHVKPSNHSPVLLVYDNHESHISLPVVDLAKANGVVLLTIPPHTSHKLQPLDRTVFGAYKTFYNQAANEWMLQNPGKPISLYQVAEIIGKAYPKAFTQQNIIKGFAVTGICPINSEIFGDDEFLSGFVTDRADPAAITTEAAEVITESIDNLDKPGPSQQNIVTLEMIRPYPKAAPRKTKGGRKKGKTRILTETPEKNQIEAEFLERQAKKSKAKVRKVTKQVFDESSDDDVEIPVQNSSDDDDYLEKLVEDENAERNEEITMENEMILEGDFVLVELKGKKSVQHCIAEIKKILEDGFDVIYLKKIMNSNKFVKTEQFYEITESDILRKLPKPSVVGGSERLNEQLSFQIDFMSFNMY